MGILTGQAGTEPKNETFSPASSFIELVEYDEKAKAMDITFRNGSKHRYLQTYPSTFLSFKLSPTHSAFYARAIKGNLPSVAIVLNNIGQPKSTPLKKIVKDQPLDKGLRKQLARDRRASGTVARAFSAAA